MSDNAQRPAGDQEPRDPWAPPEHRVPLEKPPAPPANPVHDQPTVAAMPGIAPDAGPGPQGPGYSVPGQPAPGQPGTVRPPGFVPAPPVAPGGPGPSAPGAYGYPSYPGAGGQPASYGGYPGYPGYGAQGGWNTMQQGPANGLGVAALVLGIVGVVVFCAWGLGIIIGTLALIFGILGRKRANRGEANNGGMALAGIILGSIGIVIGAVTLCLYIWAIQHSHDSDPYDYDDGSYSSALVIDAGR
ncbi:DUF4190 domain-containing protein [Streptomyces sp. NBC_00344]|uniref:DUF4190 domain-containing protein n=1 Tax=Streptomyces sp. NBC_00344 TaxID=2975720 RepID=UPI002E20B2C0